MLYGQTTKSRGLWPLIICAALAVVGCTAFPTGPDSSMAPFVKIADDDEPSGKVSASSSLYFAENAIVGPVGGGSLTTWSEKHHYDLVLRATLAGASIQGNIVVADLDRFRAGLVHGIGLNGGNSLDRNLWYATGAIFAQQTIGTSSALYGGLRYVQPFHKIHRLRHFVDLSTGWSLRRGTLQFGPELMWKISPQPLSRPVLSLNFHVEAQF